MTSGSSQGLFVIVAVVIFGIFVVIGYLLFRDKLQTGLASIFDDSITEANSDIVPFSDLTKAGGYQSTITFNEATKTYTITPTGGTSTSNSKYPVGIRNNSKVEVPWGYRFTMVYEIYYEGETNLHASLDYNAFPKNFADSWNSNDNFGNYSAKKLGLSMYEYQELTPNTWNKIEIWYENNSNKNTKQESIFEGASNTNNYGTVIGIQQNEANKLSQFKIRNVQYKLSKIQD